MKNVSMSTPRHINSQDRKIINTFFISERDSCSLALTDLWWDDELCLCELNPGVSINPETQISQQHTSLTVQMMGETSSCRCCHQ